MVKSEPGPTTDNTLAELRQVFQKQCPHLKTSRQGSNGFRTKVTCKDCGKVIVDEETITKKVHQKGKETQQQASPYSFSTTKPSPVSPVEVEEELLDYQDFLQWRQQHQATSSQPQTAPSGRIPWPADPIEDIDPMEFAAWTRFKKLQAGSGRQGAKMSRP